MITCIFLRVLFSVFCGVYIWPSQTTELSCNIVTKNRITTERMWQLDMATWLWSQMLLKMKAKWVLVECGNTVRCGCGHRCFWRWRQSEFGSGERECRHKHRQQSFVHGLQSQTSVVCSWESSRIPREQHKRFCVLEYWQIVIVIVVCGPNTRTLWRIYSFADDTAQHYFNLNWCLLLIIISFDICADAHVYRGI